MDSIEQCIVERARHEQELQNRLNERKLQIQECKIQKVNASNACSGDTDSSGIVSDIGNDQSLENHSNTSGDKSSRSRNGCNDKSTSGDDTDIRPSYDTEPMVEVPYTAEYNVFVVDTQYSEQPECIINTCVGEKVDSNVILDSLNMSDNEIHTDQNFEIQDLKAQLQDKDIAISELKKLIEKNKGKVTLYLASSEKSSFAKPYDVNAPGPSRNSPKHVSFQSPRESIGSNDMFHNYYLEEAKKKAQLQKDKALNTKPSVQQSARLLNTANGDKLKPRNFNQ
ncbi:hypothetical protein Tco_0752438 [Tanacetum coccineum]|uniref:Uncharacterized protein n=1 Tax=Tanacetum coccineum TaxID=301880 RepID=A0ABQ4Z9M9_9ASTR